MKDIEPNPHLNKWLAGWIAVMAALPLYIGIQSMTFLPVEEWSWSLVPLAIGGVILGLAVLAWCTSPINAACVTFRTSGFQLSTKRVFRGESSVDLVWDDISEIVRFDGGLYGGRSFRVRHRAGEMLFAASWTDVGADEIISRFAASADASGFGLERETGFWRGLLQVRWVVNDRARL